MFIAGVCVFTFGSALCGLAPSMRMLIAARVLQGVGGAMMIPQTLALTPALFPPHERGLAFSLFGLTAGLASVAGPVVGGLLIRADILALGWRPIFLVNIPIGVAAVFAALRFVPAPPGSRELRQRLRRHRHRRRDAAAADRAADRGPPARLAALELRDDGRGRCPPPPASSPGSGGRPAAAGRSCCRSPCSAAATSSPAPR